MRIAILYGSNTGKTRGVAEQLHRLIPGSDLWNVAVSGPGDLATYEAILLGTSTWGTGVLQDDWAVKLASFPPGCTEGKAVAFFGLGDRFAFPETFCSGVFLLEARFVPRAAKVLAPALLLDDDNHPELTEGLVLGWAARIKEAALGDR